jgi:CBS domain containing-hemolysin-like protein
MVNPTPFWQQIVDFLAFDVGHLAEGDMVFRLSLQLCLLLGSAFFSSSETALFSLSNVDLEQLRRKRHPRADQIHDLLGQPRRLIISILCGNELINIAAAANMTGILIALYGVERAGWISVMVMVPLLLLFGEITPKTVAITYPVQLSTKVISAPLGVWVLLVTPLRWLIRIISDRITTWIVGEARDADHLLRMSEFRSLVAEIEEEGLVSATDRVLVYNLLEAGDTEIEYIMTPRIETNYLQAQMSVSEAVNEFVKYKRLRMPVYEKTRDDLLGFVHAEDVAEMVGKGKEDLTCRDILRPSSQVPLTNTVDEMLDFFQSQNERAAMVINEFGGVSGIITIEDVLGFIFGEIAGDFVDPATYTKEGEQVYQVSGNMKLADFEALTNFGIQDKRMITIGGVAFRYLGRLPKENDVVLIENTKITILEMEGNRIARLKAEKVGDLGVPAEEQVSLRVEPTRMTRDKSGQ